MTFEVKVTQAGESTEASDFGRDPSHQVFFCSAHLLAARALSYLPLRDALQLLHQARQKLMVRGLPGEVEILNPERLYVFDINRLDGRPWIQIPSTREDSTFFAPQHWEQQEWLLALGLGLKEAGIELSWYLDEASMRMLLRRLLPVALIIPDHLQLELRNEAEAKFLAVNPELFVTLLKLGLPLDERGIGKIAHDPITGTFHQVNGYFDKDEQRFVETCNVHHPEAALPSLVRDWSEETVRGFLVNGYNALAFDSYLQGNSATTVAYAARAREIQEGASSVAWRFAEVFQALAALLKGNLDEGRAFLATVEPLTLWHAFAGLYGYANDEEHMRALWTATHDLRTKLEVGAFRAEEQRAAAFLRGRGLNDSQFRLSRFRRASMVLD